MNRKLKGTFKSLTIWFNGVAASIIVGWPYLADSLPQLVDYLTPEAYKSLMGIVILGNILLRFKTNKPLDQK